MSRKKHVSFFYNKLGIGSKNTMHSDRRFVLYPKYTKMQVRENDFYRVPEKLSGSRQKIERKNEKGKIELVSKTKD